MGVFQSVYLHIRRFSTERHRIRHMSAELITSRTPPSRARKNGVGGESDFSSLVLVLRYSGISLNPHFTLIRTLPGRREASRLCLPPSRQAAASPPTFPILSLITARVHPELMTLLGRSGFFLARPWESVRTKKIIETNFSERLLTFRSTFQAFDLMIKFDRF